MGNCIRHESESQWGGEDWSGVLMTNEEKSDMKMEQHVHGFVGLNNNGKNNKGYTTTTTTEVKIKITKKQLEKLQGRFDAKQDGLSVEQVLAQLIKLSAHYETHQRSGWRPRLQSIPEV